MNAIYSKENLIKLLDREPTGLLEAAAYIAYFKYRKKKINEYLSLKNARHLSDISDLLRGKKNRDFFYILANGASVEYLTDDHFKQISKGVSVGVNSWPLHWFTPDIFSFEEYNLYEKVTKLGLALKWHQREGLDFSILLTIGLKKTDMILHLLEGVSRDFYMCVGIPILTEKKTCIFSSIDKYIALRKRDILPSWILLSAEASIFRLALLALMEGFKNVVLVGVDLNNSRYFWEENPRHLYRHGIERFGIPTKTKIHKTNDSNRVSLPISDSIYALNDYAATRFGAKILVAHSSSTLANGLDLHEWL